jgi:hypothetical protein
MAKLDGSILAAVFESGCGGMQPAEFGVRLVSGVSAAAIIRLPSRFLRSGAPLFLQCHPANVSSAGLGHNLE